MSGEHGGKLANGGVRVEKGKREVIRPKSLTDATEFLRNRTLRLGPSGMEFLGLMASHQMGLGTGLDSD